MLPSGSAPPKQRRFGAAAAILSISMSLVVLSPFAVFGLDVSDSSSVVTPCSDDDPYCVALDEGEAPPCGLWMGKSPIKEREEHSFGLGVFTGVNIPQGASVDVSPLMMVPDWDDARLPPLREYVWLGQNLMHLSLGTESGIFLFYPGVASLAPCTSQNFNLALSDDRADLDETYDLHRSADAAAGAVETTRSGMYRAARDIVAGEELTVECTDASFDGGAHALNRFHADDHAVTCLDDRLEVREPSSHAIRVGRGLFAKRALAAGEVVISSPVVPVHRDELDLAPGPNDRGIDFTNSQNFPMPKWQLLLNYCFGHPDSDLLFLPVGSLVSYFNHPPAGKTANVEVRWHELLEGDEGVGAPEDSQRQRYHFPELFAMDGTTVANKQGMGLMIDYVATRPIAPDEEATVDYGPLWEAAWKQHLQQWELGRAHRAANYQSAAEFTESEQDVGALRTIVEQINDPYPAHIWTACTFSDQWADPEDDVESVTTSWYNPDQDDVNCMLPCVVLERHLHASFEDDDGRAEGEHFYYKIQLVDRTDNVDVDFECTMLENLDYFVTDVPRSAISFIDAPYSTDRYLEHAFRQEMGVPKGLYPATWMRKKLRGAKGMSKANIGEGAEFRVREARKTLEERGKK